MSDQMRIDVGAYFRIYPRGFMGAKLEAKIEPIGNAFDAQMRRVQPTFTFTPPNGNNIEPNEDIEMLYGKMMSGINCMGDFAFRKDVLITALQAFGINDFRVWYLTQLKSPAFGNTHSDFIDDTLRFIETGSRNMSITTWNSLLGQCDNIIGQRHVSENAETYFRLGKNPSQYMEDAYTMSATIARWTAAPNGFEDLLSSLHILFGKY